MPVNEEAELSERDIDAFLGEHETGVLTLARGDDPYAIPISYGYDPSTQQFYLRLVSTTASEKREFLASAPRARLVIYEEEGNVYRSVIVKGVLSELPKEELSVEDIVQYGDAKRPLFEMWGAEKPALDVKLYQLSPERMNGRRIVVDRDGS